MLQILFFDLVSNTETTIHGGYDGYVYNIRNLERFFYLHRADQQQILYQAFYRSPDLCHLGDPGYKKKYAKSFS